MAPLSTRVKIIGKNLHSENCDGTWLEYPIPCTCEGQDDTQMPDPPLTPGTSMCQASYAIENKMWQLFAGFQEIVQEWDDGTGSEYNKFVGITRWIGFYKLPLNIYNQAYAFWNTYRPELPSLSSYHDPDGVAYLLSVCASNNALEQYQVIGQDWLSFWAAQLTTLDETGLDPGTWQCWHDFLLLIPVAWIKSWYLDQLGTPLFGAFPDDCSGCDDPGEPQDCFSDHVVYIPVLTGNELPAGFSADNVSQFNTYADFMDGSVFNDTWYPSSGRFGLGDWVTIPTDVTSDNHPGIALIYEPEDPICVFRIGMTTNTGTSNTRRLGIYGWVGSEWVKLAYRHIGLDTEPGRVFVDSGHINVTNIEKIAFLFLSGGGHPEIEGIWINHVK